MDSREKFLYWESKATYDLETARAMLQTGRYTYVIELGKSDFTNDKLVVRRMEEYKTFFSDLLFYYIAERYPDYKQQISSTVTESKAKEILTLAEEVFSWLHSLSRYKK